MPSSVIMLAIVLALFLSTSIVCEGVKNCNSVQNSLRQLDEHLKLSMRSDFPPKPISGKLVNYCSSFDRTCCSKGLEQKLAAEASRNFKQDLDYVVTRQTEFCRKLKTSLPLAVQDALRESLLSEIIPVVKSTNISKDVHNLLSPLLKYLNEFAFESDICSRLDVIEKQLLQIAKQVYHNQISNPSCFESVLKQSGFVTVTVKSIMKHLEPLLGKLRFILQGFVYRQQIIEFMSSYQAQQYCTKSLMLMTFCSTCTHGTKMVPCHNLCVNTVQGCLTDFADLHFSVGKMVNMLDMIKSQLDLSVNIKHVGIRLARYIVELKDDSGEIKQKLITNNCIQKDSRQDSQSSEITHVIPNVVDPTTNSIDRILIDAISSELKCIMHVTLPNIPVRVCTERYRTKNNSECWPGFSGVGYTAPVAEFSRHALEANLNPVFHDMSTPAVNELSVNITRFTKEIEIVHRQAFVDDEDFGYFPYLANTKCINESEVYSGSGDDSSTTTTSTITTTSSPPPRINDIILTGPSNVNHTLPPTVAHTNKPTTSSPTTDIPTAVVVNINDTVTSTTSVTTSVPNNQQHGSGASLQCLGIYLLLPVLLGLVQ